MGRSCRTSSWPTWSPSSPKSSSRVRPCRSGAPLGVRGRSGQYSNTDAESTVPSAASGARGARLRRAGAGAGRAAVARKGAGEAFDRLMAADARWRELVPKVDELRAATKTKGKPTPEKLEELKEAKAEL